MIKKLLTLALSLILMSPVIAHAATQGSTTGKGNWDLSAATLELPNSTTCASNDCDQTAEAGRTCVDTDATTQQQLYVCEGTAGWKLQSPPTNAAYITQTANSILTGEQALSILGTGVLKNATGTGVLSIATPGTDYLVDDVAPSNLAAADFGDFTCSGSTCTIDTLAVTYAKIQNISATDRVLGKVTPGAGAIEEIATTGSGSVVRASSPVLTTPNIGNATGSVSGNAATATALSANGTNCVAGTYTRGVDASGNAESCTSDTGAGINTTPLTWNVAPANCTGDANGGVLTINGSNQIVCDTDDGGAGGGTGDITSVGDCLTGACLDGTNGTYIRIYDGNSNYTQITAVDTSTNLALALPNQSGTLARLADNVATASALSANPTNCTTNQSPAGISANGNAEGCFNVTPALVNSAGLKAALNDETGNGFAVFSITPTLTTPIIGVATATSVNKLTITPPATSATLTVADGKTLTASKTITLTSAGDSSIITLPNTTDTVIGLLSSPTLTGTWNFGGGTVEVPNSDTLPGTCVVGQFYMDTNATTGQRFYACETTDSWVLQGDGGSGGTPGGSDTYVQYNKAGVLAGDLGMVYNDATDILSLVGGLNYTGVNPYINISRATDPGAPAEGDTWYNSTGHVLKYRDNSAVRTVPSAATSKTRCGFMADLISTDDNSSLGLFVNATTITGVACNYLGTGSTPATITLEDGSGNAMTITGTNPTCAPDGTNATFAAVTAANTLVAGEKLRFDVTNTPSPVTDDYTICVSYTD